MSEIIVILEIKDAVLFEAYENKVLEIMKDHGGQLVRVFNVDVAGVESSPSNATEVHHLKFPDLQKFKNYRVDYQLLALKEKRKEAIQNTTILVSKN